MERDSVCQPNPKTCAFLNDAVTTVIEKLEAEIGIWWEYNSVLRESRGEAVSILRILEPIDLA